MRSSTKIDNRKKDILILSKGPAKQFEHTLSVEKCIQLILKSKINNEKFCLSLHYNRANSYLFVNDEEIHKFKAKDSEIVATPSCLGNISKDWSVDNMKSTGLNGYVYDFIVDYSNTAVDDFLDIHNYLMKKITQYKMFGFVKQIFISAMMFFWLQFIKCKLIRMYFNEKSRM